MLYFQRHSFPQNPPFCIIMFIIVQQDESRAEEQVRQLRASSEELKTALKAAKEECVRKAKLLSAMKGKGVWYGCVLIVHCSGVVHKSVRIKGSLCVRVRSLDTYCLQTTAIAVCKLFVALPSAIFRVACIAFLVQDCACTVR